MLQIRLLIEMGLSLHAKLIYSFSHFKRAVLAGLLPTQILRDRPCRRYGIVCTGSVDVVCIGRNPARLLLSRRNSIGTFIFGRQLFVGLLPPKQNSNHKHQHSNNDIQNFGNILAFAFPPPRVGAVMLGKGQIVRCC